MKIVAVSPHALNVGIVAALLAGCAGSPSPGGASGVLPQSRALAVHAKGGGKIQHVVIIIQMNRSFNDLFYGYPGAKTASYGYDSENQKIELKPVSLATRWALGADADAACNGAGKLPGTDCRMNGFNDEHWTCGPGSAPRCPNKYPPYAYVPHHETKPYFTMAKRYVLADEMFASNFDASTFGSLQYIIEAQDHNTVGSPSGVPGCGGGRNDWIQTIGGGRIHPCFNNATLGDELDAAHLSWAYYEVNDANGICGNGDGNDRKPAGGLWSAYGAIKHICYGRDWNEDVISPPTQFLADVKSGNLRTVSWITPAFADSDEAGSDSTTGPSWVASLVNAVGESKYWNSTAIFVFWDSYGGWYDPVPPPQLDADGLGFRVPLLVISPYAKRGYVSHVRYEHGSILRFAEDQFALGRLGASDMRANSPQRDCFDFKQPPRKFVPI
jgi:phospholipase C